ncbi:7-deoxyloganetin glucosyltransferase-like [Vicia villosa]|uniref:7-deoxyloganetin glucosyltransferase-like n=1 Tax=Vicia villosa TaxID=3911 RepID=UPI00273A988D|nr:7-deoxyloganetin glucosyltransferase-like [Vicia villosa]
MVMMMLVKTCNLFANQSERTSPTLFVNLSRKNFTNPFRELVARLDDSSKSGLMPPITCLVSDSFMSVTIQVAEEHALPVVLLVPSSACSFLSAFHFPTLIEKGIIPLKDESYLTNGYLDPKVDWIPGLQNFRLKDLLAFIRTTNPNDLMVEFIIEVVDRFQRASVIVFNTCNDLESDVMNVVHSMFPSLYTIVPFASFLNQSPHNHLASLDSNLWKEDPKCFEWLDSKEPESIVYVNFGSTTVMSVEKLLEFAWGLANSKKPFLWIIRPDLVIGGSVVFSSEFVNEISDRGLIVGWCQQEKVLKHPSIGGFLIHCGWNLSFSLYELFDKGSTFGHSFDGFFHLMLWVIQGYKELNLKLEPKRKILIQDSYGKKKKNKAILIQHQFNYTKQSTKKKEQIATETSF